MFAIGLLIMLIALVAAALMFTSANSFTPRAVEQAKPINSIDPPAGYGYTGAGETFSDTGSGTPFNERAFTSQKAQRADSDGLTYGESRFKGRILSVSLDNGLRLRMTSLLESSYGIEVEYVYTAQTLPKIEVEGGSLEDLKRGDEINVDEANDYSLEYPESIQSVRISYM